MIDQWLSTLSDIIASNFWIAPIIALLAGILTSVLPCALSSVPLVIGYVGGIGDNNAKRSFRLSVTFALGMALTFTGLGTLASILGRLMAFSGRWLYIGIGVLMILMALQTWGIYNFIPSTYLTDKAGKTGKKGFFGAFIAGILGGVFSSPCSTPVLIVILGIVAGGGNILWGILLLLLYAIGHSFFVVAAGTSAGFVKTIIKSGEYGIFSKILQILMGTAILVLGLYMLYLGL